MQPRAFHFPSPSTRLVLAGVLIALAGAFTLAQAQPAGGPPQGQHVPGMRGHGMGGGAMGGLMTDRLLTSVNASADQRSRIEAIMKAARDDLRSQRDAGRTLHQQMAALLAAPTLDANAVEALRQQMQQQHDQASRRMTQAMLDAAAVLTPEQRAQLAQKMQQRRDMMERHQRERRALEPKS